MHLSLRSPVKTPNCLLFSASASGCAPRATHNEWHQFWRSIPPNININMKASASGLLPLKSSSLSLQYSNRRQKVLFCQKQQAPLQSLDCRSIEEVYDSLAQRLFSTLLQIQDSDSKYIVGLAGPPGAGKSTVAGEVVCRINLLWSKVPLKKGSSGEVATVLPMDGFHLYRSQLDQMEDPKEAHARRGAPWTFNPDLLLKCLYTLRKEGSVYAPSFDHGVGDPVENDIHVSSEHKIVIVEGNYLLLEEDTWKEISLFFDEKWFIDIDIDIAMERVLKRHISTGKEPDVAAWRIQYNDRPNAELIMRSKNKADLVIQSIDV
ncbi:hypothetical protein LUZ61_016573 [Rhynchospora tenuis]|uniref:Phosphoribulokinase/uridine kinase domain-containing protein n=1 Tax=Rhynchospora tenuis TaxID=198213 RepID=A0AAD6EK82_9POAL|nr:hypothetical protein LUZ61_016573 [Rhynchospora tenuis]